MKKSNSYWEKRANERMTQYHKDSNQVIQKINAAYDKAIKEINQDIDNIFYRFAEGGELTLDQAKKLLNKKIPNPLIRIYKKVLPFINNDDIKQWFFGRINAQAYKARITRLEALKESIYANIKKVADVEVEQSRRLYLNNLNKSYYRNTYDIQKGIGQVFDFSPLSVSFIEEILRNRWSGKNYSERIWDNSEVLSAKLQEVVTSGLMSGKSSKRMAKELEGMTLYGKFACERLIRTETTYITNQGEIESYKAAGIEEYIFLATLDLRTSEQCRAHDNKIYKVSEAVPGENLPPLHPYCRSTTRAYFEGMKRGPRRARDPKTGKAYLIDNMSYEDWYQKFVVDKYGEQDADKFEKMIKNKSSDRKQYENYKAILGRNAPETFDTFRDLKYNDNREYSILKAQYKGMGYYNKAVSNEPSITEHVKSVAESVGADVVGLEYRIKEKDSYLRKIRSNYNPESNEYEIKDILRYTYTADTTEYTDKILKSIDAHKDLGYNTIEVKNYWLNKNNPYNGINTIMVSPEGQKFELQYHTPGSFAVKNGEMHKLYEEWRLLLIDSEEKSNIESQMKKLSELMGLPKDIERVK